MKKQQAVEAHKRRLRELEAEKKHWEQLMKLTEKSALKKYYEDELLKCCEALCEASRDHKTQRNYQG